MSCEEENDTYYNTSPCLIVEVLSESKARTEKLFACQGISSLQEYVLCSQDTAHLDVYRRSKGWRCERFNDGQHFTLESVDLEINVDGLYYFLVNNKS